MRNTTFLFIGIVALMICGCGRKVVSVSGEVRYEDAPAKDVVILFEPKSDAAQVPYSGFAITGTDGTFVIRSAGKKSRRGLEPGDYTVYFGWNNPAPVGGSPAGPRPGDPPPPVSPYRFPKKIGAGEVVVTVKGDGRNHFVFRLTPDEVHWDGNP